MENGIFAASTTRGQPMGRPVLRRGLYAISQDGLDTPALLAWAEAVVAGGAVCLQYRDKGGEATRRREQALALARLCRAAGVPFIVNDDVALARACGADGVHLGEHDADVATARAQLGREALVGVSCYDDLGRARALAARGADYLAFGAFFPSSSKAVTRRARPGLLAAARTLGLPVVAIGGINPDNGGALVAAGADLLAVIGGLAGPPGAAGAAARRYAALFDAFPPASSPHTTAT